MPRKPAHRERVLFIPCWSALGDTIAFVSAFEAVRKAHPQAEIIVAPAESRIMHSSQQVYQSAEFYALPKIGSSLRKLLHKDRGIVFLWQNRFSAIYELGSTRHTRRFLLVARLFGLLRLRPCRTIGYQPFARYGTRHNVLPGEPAYNYGARILRGVGLTPEPIDLSHLTTSLSPELQQVIGEKPYVVFVSEGNARAASKAWLATGFAEVAQFLHAQGYSVLAIGNDKDKEKIAKIVNHNKQVINLGGKTTLAELYTLLHGAAACLAIDTGGGHLAAAAGTPLLSLLSDQGPDSPRRWAAPGAKVLLTRGHMTKHLPAKVVISALANLLAQKPIDESNFPPRVCLWSGERDQSENRKKVLLLFRNGLGEVVITWQVFQALLQQHLQDEIHCLADAALVPLLEQGADALNHRSFSVYPVKRNPNLSKFALLSTEYKVPKFISGKTCITNWHAVYDLERNRRSRATSLACRRSRFTRNARFYGERPWAPHGIFKREGRNADGSRFHARHSHLRFIKALGLTPQEADFSFLQCRLTPELQAAVGDTPHALLIVGSSGGTHCPKRWTVEGWAELAGKLAREGIQPVLIGTAVDSDTARQVAAKAPYAVNLVSQTNFAQLYSLAARASCIVSGDTGAGHLAGTAAARHKVPMLSLFGEATDPERWLPPSALAIQHKPLRQLKADAVWQKLHPLLPVRHK